MRDIAAELKSLRLYGMANTWEEVAADGNSVGIQTSRWLIEHLLQAEHTDRHMRSINYQMLAAKFPVHRDLAGFEFEQSKVDKSLIEELASLSFTEQAHNVVLIGGTGTGKTHLATALGFAACGQGKRVRFASTTALVTELLEARESRALARLQKQLERLDLLILDELGYVPFSKTGAELLFDVVSRAYERTSLIVTTNLPFENWTEVLGSERLTGAMLDRLTHRVHILEANGASYRLKDAKKRLKRS
jgi:DNA replication protein DnaC